MNLKAMINFEKPRYVKEASVAGVEPVRERAFGSELKQVQRGAQTV